MKESSLDYIKKILEFYENEQSIGYENGIFKEYGSENMVLRRLERAVKDEADSNVLHSRYAIWAHDLINIIDAAKNAVTCHDEEIALKQLNLAENAIKAYKDIMTVFDGEDHKVRDIFNGYVAHLLNVDDRYSSIIEKDEIIARLKKYSGVSGAALPRDIDFSIKNRVLRIYIQNAAQDMQKDSSAFRAGFSF